jgi:murein DD-endopeptidase MepM/ murein hydrolase activator NlpD
VRQRLSSEPDRYRGRRRVPTPPRSRYAAVATSAFVGAGIVALGAASNMPDAKAVNPMVLADLKNSAATADQLAERADNTERASRDAQRGVALPEVSHKDLWLLPLKDYTFTSPYGMRWNTLHAGIDLSAPEGTPYQAVHSGVVKRAGYDGGYGFAVVVQHPDGTEAVYAHSRRVLVRAGDTVKAGQDIGEVGATGHAYGTHLHFEMHVNGTPRDPVRELKARGVDIKLQVEAVYGGLSAS